MKFSLETITDKNYIQSYSPDHLVITSDGHSESVQLTGSIILSPDQIITDRQARKDLELDESDIFLLKTLEPELVIFVSDPTISPLSPEIVIAFSANAIGVECMSLPAACRTYNLLVAEGRRVLLLVNFL
jgi:uncharacterized protein